MGVEVTLSTAERNRELGQTVRLLTWLHVKEEILELYGFADAMERSLFLKLIKVSGIGPRMALRLLSSTSPTRLGDMILNSDVRGLSSLKGIGKKTAEVMIASLRTSVGKMDWSDWGISEPGQESKGTPVTRGNPNLRDAVAALISLGVKDLQAQTAVEKALAKLGEDTQVSTLIAQALQEV
jgi:Holliday junction DNA helicase RuvA